MTLKQLAQVFEESTGKKLNIKWGALPYRDREVMEPVILENIITLDKFLHLTNGIKLLY